MATRTISNAGGNWSAVGTWVEGVVPTNADDVVATATSGNLVLNTTCDCSTMDLTGYAGTMSNSGGTLRIFGGSIIFGGTITATNTLQLFTVAPTITSNGITWPGSISFPGGITTTISGTLTVGGNLTLSNGKINGDNIYFGGNLTTGGNQIGAPTSTLIANGTGDQTWSGNFVFRQPLTINKASGNFIVSGVVSKSTGTLTYTAGTVVTTGSTLTIVASTTLDTDGITWNNVTITAASTITCNSVLTGTGTLTLPNAAVTFDGASGFDFNNLITSTLTGARNYTLKSGNTYTINNSLISNSNTTSFRPTFRSSVAASQAILTLGTSATQNLKFVNATDINSSLGQQINSNKGTLSNATNWYRTNGTFMYLMQL